MHNLKSIVMTNFITNDVFEIIDSISDEVKQLDEINLKFSCFRSTLKKPWSLKMILETGYT